MNFYYFFIVVTVPIDYDLYVISRRYYVDSVYI